MTYIKFLEVLPGLTILSHIRSPLCISFYWYGDFLTLLNSVRGNLHGVVANIWDCVMLVTEFEFQSYYCTHVRKVMGQTVQLLFNKDDFGIELPMKVVMLLNKETKSNNHNKYVMQPQFCSYFFLAISLTIWFLYDICWYCLRNDRFVGSLIYTKLFELRLTKLNC